MDSTATTEPCHRKHRRRTPETSTAALLTTTTIATTEKPVRDRGSSPEQHRLPPPRPTPVALPKHNASAVDNLRASNRQSTTKRGAERPAPPS
jgi:hypothetical protein